MSPHSDPLEGSSVSLDHVYFPDHHHDEDEAAGARGVDVPDGEFWDVENVELHTVGIDIGSSTSHLMFAKVHMQRLAQGLSSRFVVVDRKVVWRSPVVLTPYLPDNSIDADVLGTFVRECYVQAGVERDAVDTGAVVLTGEALKRRNARAIADLFASESGTFVCASAGHHLEAAMAAHGSGAVADTRGEPGVRLHVDIGGGTAKLALIADGSVLGTAAVAVGGRLVALEGRRVVRVESPALRVAETLRIPLVLGQELTEENEGRLVRAFVEILLGCIENGRIPPPYPDELLLVNELPSGERPRAVSFSGGVAEYFYGREWETFGDVASSLAAALRAAVDSGELDLAVVDARAHIRATVIGASQFSVQVSGNTVGLAGEHILPLRNLPVLFPRVELDGDFEVDAVASAIAAAARRFDVEGGSQPVAVALRWSGDPDYWRLRTLAEGVVDGLSDHIGAGHPVVVLLDGDLARSLARLLTDELRVQQPVVCLDGVRLQEFDYVDIGEAIRPAGVVPVIIKSLLFDAPDKVADGSGVLTPEARTTGIARG